MVPDAWVVRVPDHPWVGEGWSCLIVPHDRQVVWGDFVGLDAATRTTRVRPEDMTQLNLLHPGDEYPFFDGYWGQAVELVLGPPRNWTETVFQPSDAVVYPAGGGQMMVPASGEIPQGAHVAPGAWEHEHCAICWETIGHGGDPKGFLSTDKRWICAKCHMSYVIPKLIGFVETPKPRA